MEIYELLNIVGYNRCVSVSHAFVLRFFFCTHLNVIGIIFDTKIIYCEKKMLLINNIFDRLTDYFHFVTNVTLWAWNIHSSIFQTQKLSLIEYSLLVFEKTDLRFLIVDVDVSHIFDVYRTLKSISHPAVWTTSLASRNSSSGPIVHTAAIIRPSSVRFKAP